MERTSPINVESPFSIEELFFSITDHRGIILTGNQVFVRVSKFTAAELRKKAHNIIRHPDMPKTVFRLLWDTIQANQPIAAYVKNMAKDGSYYWVFALVLPLGDKYLSIRLKPSSAFFEKVAGLYSLILAEEKEKDIEAGLALVLSSLNSLGFTSYQAFMTAVLAAELQSRDLKVTKPHELSRTHVAKTVEEKVSRALLALDFVFECLSRIVNESLSLRKTTDSLRASFIGFGYLSINMSIGAERLGKDGRAVGEVARGFQKQASQIESQAGIFQDSLQRVINRFESSLFEVGSTKIGIEMLSFFLKESKSLAVDETLNFAADIATNFKTLCTCLVDSTAKTLSELEQLKSEIYDFKARSSDLMEVAVGMEVIRITGKVEVAKLSGQQGQGFANQIERMSDFLHNLTHSLKEVSQSAATIISDSEAALSRLRAAQSEIANLE